MHLQISIFLTGLPWCPDASCTLVEQLHGLGLRLFDKVLPSLHEGVNDGLVGKDLSG
jgi:hypothetical protein